MAATIRQMIAAVERYRDEIEAENIAQARELVRVFDRASVRLYELRDAFDGLRTEKGRIVRDVGNIQEAARIMSEVVAPAIQREVVDPGKRWSQSSIPTMNQAGRELARMNMDVEFISQELVDAAFNDIIPVERALVVRSLQDSYRVMGTTGSDIGEFMRRQLMDSVVEGIPVVNRSGGDSLAKRIFESGRIKPIRTVGRNGQIVSRSMAQRAESIARVESAKIIEQTHETLTEAAIGSDGVYINSNPQDSRTTDICERASRQGPMTLEEWVASPFGKPPRINSGYFHLCRSTLIGGRPEWFKDL